MCECNGLYYFSINKHPYFLFKYGEEMRHAAAVSYAAPGSQISSQPVLHFMQLVRVSVCQDGTGGLAGTQHKALKIKLNIILSCLALI